MIKKMIILICIFLILSGCSQETKFGMQQFVIRMNKQYGTTYKTADFLYGTDESNQSYMFYDSADGLITLSLNDDNSIIGVSLLITESMDINKGINTFCNICCVFTGNDEEAQQKVLLDCKINYDTIKFADNNMVITVGKYKYAIVCNEYSVTLFCDRV